jgi:hypothetical protein
MFLSQDKEVNTRVEEERGLLACSDGIVYPSLPAYSSKLRRHTHPSSPAPETYADANGDG